MRLGIIVDGDAEYYSLPRLFQKVELSHVIVKILKARIDPLSSAGAIARGLRPALIALESKRVEHAILLMDFEHGSDCPGERALRLTAGLAACGRSAGISQVTVVLKNTRLENWLISDTNALQELRGRFKIPEAKLRSIHPDKADGMDAGALLRAAAIKRGYEKVRDAGQILGRARPDEIAMNSRSFRRLLRVIGDPRFATQSRTRINL